MRVIKKAKTRTFIFLFKDNDKAVFFPKNTELLKEYNEALKIRSDKLLDEVDRWEEKRILYNWRNQNE